jgi:hypothetical protein
MNQTISPLAEPGTAPVFVTMLDPAFERELLERLSRVEAKLDTLVGNGQPGRMRIAEERLATLERDNIRRTVYDRILSGIVALVISAVVALHDHFGLK